MRDKNGLTICKGDSGEEKPQWSPSWEIGGAAMKEKEKVADQLGGHKMRDLPITLPSSLEIAILRLPVPMSETDYKTLINSLTSMKDTLVTSEKK